MKYYTECRIGEVSLEEDGKVYVKLVPTEEFSFEGKQQGQRYLLFVEDIKTVDAKTNGAKSPPKVLLLSLDTAFCLPCRVYPLLRAGFSLKQVNLRIKVEEQEMPKVVSVTIL